MTLLRVLVVAAVVIYFGYGVRRFGFDLYTSPRFVRRPPSTGLWGPLRFLSPETWTEEGLRERNRMLAWQIGGVALLILAFGLW